MSTPLLGSALPRRLASGLMAALFSVTLALNPVSAPTANAAVSARVGASVVRVAARQVGVPYRWGGTTRAGFDCSGLTLYSYARVGKRLPRTAQQQYNATIRISRRAARPGDLVFFYSGNPRNSVYHVGVYAGNWTMYVAPHKGARVQKQRIWSNRVVFGRVR
ncbi:MAG TPA: C40 family peptidase [Dermatophilaceae bacterium]